MSIHDPRTGDKRSAVNVPQRLAVILVACSSDRRLLRRSEPDVGRNGSDADDLAGGRVVCSHRRNRLADHRIDRHDNRRIEPPPPGAISVETAPLSFAYEPSAPTAAAGTVSFFISNATPEGPKVGRRHNMAIGRTLGEALVESTSVEEGKAVTFTVQDLPSGDYLVFCTVLDSGTAHYNLGMKGTLTVTP